MTADNPAARVDLDALTEDLTLAVMAHYGYTPDDIAEAEAVHPGLVCGEDCWDEDGENVHPSAYNDLGVTAALMVDVVTPLLADRLAPLLAERDNLSSALAAANDKRRILRTAVTAARAERDEARAERDAERGFKERYHEQWMLYADAVKRAEALADWHETKADKARRFRPEVNGENPVMDKAADVHDDAARRLRAALADPEAS